MILYDLATNDGDLQDIIELQEQNLPAALSSDEMKDQGFVTLRHDLALLRKICGLYQHVVARDDKQVIGYALVMLKDFAGEISMLIPMFNKIDALIESNQKLRRYVVMGQICIDKTYRGRGVFRGLYDKMKVELAEDFDVIITEVDQLNSRSLNAHLHAGFEILSTYKSDQKSWVLLGLSTKRE